MAKSEILYSTFQIVTETIKIFVCESKGEHFGANIFETHCRPRSGRQCLVYL